MLADVAARLAELEYYLQTYPASVAEVSYGGDAPPLVQLGTLLSVEGLEGEHYPDLVLERFVTRLRSARSDLTVAELLALPVPVSAGDQEVYTARLGKWLFEKRLLAREVMLGPQRV